MRICVEWMIGKLFSTFKMLQQFTMHCLFRDALAQRFATAVVLVNAHTTLYGSEAALYFDCQPPTLEEYLDPFFDEAHVPLE